MTSLLLLLAVSCHFMYSLAASFYLTYYMLQAAPPFVFMTRSFTRRRTTPPVVHVTQPLRYLAACRLTAEFDSLHPDLTQVKSGRLTRLLCSQPLYLVPDN